MILVDHGYTITRWDPEIDLREMCDAAETCYQSPAHKSKKDQEKFIRSIRDRGHRTPLEHSILSVKFVTNRGVTHELVRHRLASPNQESTRYCCYDKDKFDNNVRFIRDTSVPEEDMDEWLRGCKLCEEEYFNRLKIFKTPDRARGALNNDVKSTIKITTNYREWRHIFQLRCDDAHAHYQMVELMSPLLNDVRKELPCVFDDISY